MAPTTKAELVAEVEKLRAALRRERAKTARLGGALAESREHQAATSDILRGISSSPADVQPVFDASCGAPPACAPAGTSAAGDES